ncbi:MAG: hypothetical protein K5656_10360 [Lachnospiraceae bacterium]|nr:hypothetical protein [Lachnospiraceae bacterium]
MKKKGLGIVLSFSLIASLFSGCGQGKVAGDYTNKSEMSFKALDYVTLGEYTGLEYYDIDVDVTEDEVKEELDSSLYDYAEYEDVTNRGAKSEDYVNFDYSATIDGVAIADCAYQDYEIQLGCDEFDKTIEKSMIGKKPGEVYTVEATITEDLGESHLGEKALFTITINTVQIEHLPELTDAFVKENTDYETVEEYKNSIKQDLIDTKKSEYESDLGEKMLDTITEKSTFKDKPDELVKICTDAMYSDAEYQGEMFGMTQEEVINEFFEEGEFEEAIDDEVELRLIVYALAEQETRFYTDKALEKYEEKMAKEYEYESVEEYVSDYGEDVIRYESTYENVVNFLIEKANVKKIDEKTYLEQNPDLYDEEEDEALDEEGLELDEESEANDLTEDEDLSDESDVDALDSKDETENDSKDETEDENDDQKDGNVNVTEADLDDKPVLFETN